MFLAKKLNWEMPCLPDLLPLSSKKNGIFRQYGTGEMIILVVIIKGISRFVPAVERKSIAPSTGN